MDTYVTNPDQNDAILGRLKYTIQELDLMKSSAQDSDTARYLAVTKTELEKVYAYFKTFVVSE